MENFNGGHIGIQYVFCLSFLGAFSEHNFDPQGISSNKNLKKSWNATSCICNAFHIFPIVKWGNSRKRHIMHIENIFHSHSYWKMTSTKQQHEFEIFLKVAQKNAMMWFVCLVPKLNSHDLWGLNPIWPAQEHVLSRNIGKESLKGEEHFFETHSSWWCTIMVVNVRLEILAVLFFRVYVGMSTNGVRMFPSCKEGIYSS